MVLLLSLDSQEDGKLTQEITSAINLAVHNNTGTLISKCAVLAQTTVNHANGPKEESLSLLLNQVILLILLIKFVTSLARTISTTNHERYQFEQY